MENNLDDPKNIAGLSNLLKDDDIESNMDLAELEREIANGAHISQEEEVNVAEQYRNEMDRLSRNFDIGVSDTPIKSNNLSIQTELSPDSSPLHSPVHSPVQSVPHSNNIPSYNYYNSPRQSQIHDYKTKTNNDREKVNWDSYEPGDSQLRSMTTEERRQDKINNVLRDIDDKELEFSIDKEREDDDKASLLEQIDMLKITLEDDGVDITGVPVINKQSVMKDIQNVYKILRLKNDRNRYCSFAEELILSGAYGMEYLFDGKKDWFNKKPDLTDWSSTVKVKLRRMRYETSTFVGEVMQEYNLSAGVRLALELLPSMFLYSRNRRLAKNDNLVSDNDYKNAISQLNSI
jgi:hypothetical protein